MAARTPSTGCPPGTAARVMHWQACCQAICDDLDRMVGRQQVDENTGVLFGVPDTVLTKNLQGTAAGAQSATQRLPAQPWLEREADFTPMTGFTGTNGRFDAVESCIVERPQDRIGRQATVTPPGHQATV